MKEMNEMKPKALINLPYYWTWVVWGAAALSFFSFMLDFDESKWGDILGLCATLADIAVWTAIILDLWKRNLISPELMRMLGLSFVFSLLAAIVSFSDGDVGILLTSLLAIITWLASRLMIRSSYSGLFRKYAIVDIYCALGLAALEILIFSFPVLTATFGFQKIIVKYAAGPLYFLSYQALNDAINEGDEPFIEEDEPLISE